MANVSIPLNSGHFFYVLFAEGLLPDKVSIPLNSGHFFYEGLRQVAYYDPGLNPFEFRAFFLRRRHVRSSMRQSRSQSL